MATQQEDSKKTSATTATSARRKKPTVETGDQQPEGMAAKKTTSTGSQAKRPKKALIASSTTTPVVPLQQTYTPLFPTPPLLPQQYPPAVQSQPQPQFQFPLDKIFPMISTQTSFNQGAYNQPWYGPNQQPPPQYYGGTSTPAMMPSYQSNYHQHYAPLQQYPHQPAQPLQQHAQPQSSLMLLEGLLVHDLTFNSKPVINQITITCRDLANTRPELVPSIIDLLLTHLARAPVNLKLPALYAIDSVLKNVAGMFKCEAMSTKLPWVFLGAIGELIEADNKRAQSGILEGADMLSKHIKDFVRVLGTWKQMAIFPTSVLDEIEQNMKNRFGLGPTPSLASTAISSNPLALNSTQIATNSVVGVKQLPPLPPSSELLNILLTTLQKKRRDQGTPGASAALADFQHRLRNLLIHLRHKAELDSNHLDALDQVCASLLSSGEDSTLQPVIDQVLALLLILEPPDLSDATSLLKFRSHAPLYSDLALQCKVCGVRYESTDSGQLALASHLDAHFKKRMMAMERSSIGQEMGASRRHQHAPLNTRMMIRGVFMSQNEWVHYDDNLDGGGESSGATNDGVDTTSNQPSSATFVDGTQALFTPFRKPDDAGNKEDQEEDQFSYKQRRRKQPSTFSTSTNVANSLTRQVSTDNLLPKIKLSDVQSQRQTTGTTSIVCPACLEPIDTRWSPEVEDFVLIDAVYHKKKNTDEGEEQEDEEGAQQQIYHINCV